MDTNMHCVLAFGCIFAQRRPSQLAVLEATGQGSQRGSARVNISELQHGDQKRRSVNAIRMYRTNTTSMMALRKPLHDTVSSQVRIEIVRSLWPRPSPKTLHDDQPDMDGYFSFYAKECNRALLDQGQHLSARNHEDLLKAASLLKTKTSKQENRLELRRHLTPGRSSKAEDEMLDGTINLATRLFAMVNNGPLQNKISPQWSIPWSDEPLDKAVHAYFNDYGDSDSEDNVLQIDFTACNMVRDARIHVV
jgi:hypothetical protein